MSRRVTHHYKVYDGYRPQLAVNDFAQWAKPIDNVAMKAEFYPSIDKKIF